MVDNSCSSLLSSPSSPSDCCRDLFFPGQPHILIMPLPPSCYLFSRQDIRHAVWVMNTSKAVDEEGF